MYRSTKTTLPPPNGFGAPYDYRATQARWASLSAIGQLSSGSIQTRFMLGTDETVARDLAWRIDVVSAGRVCQRLFRLDLNRPPCLEALAIPDNKKEPLQELLAEILSAQEQFAARLLPTIHNELAAYGPETPHALCAHFLIHLEPRNPQSTLVRFTFTDEGEIMLAGWTWDFRGEGRLANSVPSSWAPAIEHLRSQIDQGVSDYVAVARGAIFDLLRA